MSEAVLLFDGSTSLAKHLKFLRSTRKASVALNKTEARKRVLLSASQRVAILKKTNGRCHICGGVIDSKWQADHVLAHANGGSDTTENFLPAHDLCNNYRWNYGTEEFQWIMKLGVHFRTLIELQDADALKLAAKFIRAEHRRHARRKQKKV
jgi:hypothetical protein